MKRYEPTQVFTVGELTREVRVLLEQSFRLVWIVGEVSNFRTPGSGHWYFTLKDERAQISAVMFRGNNRALRFHPEDGTEMLARGRLTVYEPRGQYQLVIEHMEPKGIGALQVAYEQLREKLAAEGLFDESRKRPLPYLPERVGLITSISGAVVRDICNVMFRRFPGVSLRIHPVRVQGRGAAEEIAAAVHGFAGRRDADVLILARGGGSLEDLWAFNEEIVARAVAASPIPTVSAVGHETDFTICDFVADVRAPTPSAAAELVVPVREELVGRIRALEGRLARRALSVVGENRLRVRELRQVLEDPRLALAGLRRRVDEAEEQLLAMARSPLTAGTRRVEELRVRLFAASPRIVLASSRSRVENLSRTLRAAAPRRARSARERVAALAAMLDALSPLGVLSRGYSVTQLSDGTLVRQADQAPAGTTLRIRLEKGRLEAEVSKTENDP